MRTIFKSFSTRLNFYILTLTCLIFICIAIVFNSYSKQREEEQAVQYTSLLQQNLLQKVDFELERVEHTVRNEVPRVILHLNQPHEMMRIVSNMVGGNSLIMGGSLAFVPDYYPEKGHWFMEYAHVTEKDNVVCKHLGGKEYDYFEKSWYKDAFSHRKGMWTDPYFDKGGGNKLMTTFSLPLYDQKGLPFAVFTADVSLEDLSLNVNAIRPFPNSYSFILNRKGTYISHPDKNVIQRNNIYSRAKDLNNQDLLYMGKRMLKGEKGWKRLVVDGVDVLVCYAPLNRTDWSICSVCPYTEVMSELGSATWQIFAILLGGLLLLSVCVRVLVNVMSSPMRQLTIAAYQISKGNFDSRLPVIRTKDDLRQLHDAFEHMQESLRRYVEQLKVTTQQKQRIDSELSIAHDIQMNMVSKSFSPFPECEKLELSAILRPAKEVGGDFYDFFIRDGKLFFCIGDVSGKGVPASLVMAITKTLFRVFAKDTDSAADIMGKLNGVLSDNNEANMFVTMWIGVLDFEANDLTYCNAGHNPPLLTQTDGNLRWLETKACLPIGVLESAQYHETRLKMADCQALLLYTDGVTEAENISQEQFGTQRVLDIFSQSVPYSIRTIIDNLQQELSQFAAGAEQTDDITMLCVRMNGLWETPKHPARNERTLVVDNRLEESSRLQSFVEEIGETLHLPANLTFSLNLALEEALVNAISYAYPEGEKGIITLKAFWQDEPTAVEFELTDSGKMFNPLMVREPDMTQDVENRQVGGLGVFLVRNLMDDVKYQYRKGQNQLLMRKYINLNDKHGNKNLEK